MEATGAPVLSTPAEHNFEVAPLAASGSTLSDEQLYLQYEIRRTVREIQDGRWTRIALQFPDDMLKDAPRVSDSLSEELKKGRNSRKIGKTSDGVEEVAERVAAVDLEGKGDVQGASRQTDGLQDGDGEEERLTILADTSYGACCVDEIAAEHANADVVVHYGRSCLSPTARLPVIYVFTAQPLDLDSAVSAFKDTYPSPTDKVVLMADIPFQHHIPALQTRLAAAGYQNLFATTLLHDPSSPLPNRSVPPEVSADPDALRHFSVFHLSSPPTSLLLTLSSRIKTMTIFPTSSPPHQTNPTTALRRRYALLTTLATAPVIGILINTLSVKNYLRALAHCETLIARAGKKSYTVVVGKLNAAKVANFAEVGGWVVIGCWESSLVESAEFFRPIVTPFELEVALTDDKERVWGGEWVSDFSAVLGREKNSAAVDGDGSVDADAAAGGGSWEDEPSDDEPPDFDLRTGKYVSHSRPMGRANANPKPSPALGGSKLAPPSSSLVQRARGDLAAVNGAASPGAEFLRSQRTWQGLGSDYAIEYERDEEGRIRGAGMEEGRGGVARGYGVGGQREG